MNRRICPPLPGGSFCSPAPPKSPITPFITGGYCHLLDYGPTITGRRRNETALETGYTILYRLLLSWYQTLIRSLWHKRWKMISLIRAISRPGPGPGWTLVPGMSARPWLNIWWRWGRLIITGRLKSIRPF